MFQWNLISKLLTCCILFALVACATAVPDLTATTENISTPELNIPIVLGDISDDPAEVIEGTQPLADYLALQLADFGITEGQVKIAATVEEMSYLLSTGQVDLYFDSVYPATLVSDASGAHPILRRWRFGVEEYHSVIFASKESGIEFIGELPGHTISFDSPYSTSGFLLPSVYLLEKDLNLVGKRSFNDPVKSNDVGFVFSYDDENTLQWVLSGFVAAGVTDDYNFDVAFPESATDNLVVLARTESIPRQVVVIRSDINPNLQDAIIKILITMHDSDVGQAALGPFQTSKFDEFPEGIEAAENRMRDMMGGISDLQFP